MANDCSRRLTGTENCPNIRPPALDHPGFGVMKPLPVMYCGYEPELDAEVCTRGNIREKKRILDASLATEEERNDSRTLVGGQFAPHDYTRRIEGATWRSSKKHLCKKDAMYFCDWYPHLFGIDEESIPSSEDETDGYVSGMAEKEDDTRRDFNPALLELFQNGPWEDLTEDEMMEMLRQEYKPRYGRRARQKPTFDVNNKKLGCICDIDKSFSRHYIPQFYHGPKDELKTPHFASFWEDYRSKVENADLEELYKIFEEPQPEETTADKTYSYRPKSLFPGSKKKDIKLFREEMFARFKPLDCREVRRYRMSYAEALYLELQEDRFLESAAFFKSLLKRDHIELEKSISKRLPLRRCKPRLKKLVLFLKVAERFSRNKEYHKEATILLKSGKYFNDHDESWWWLAEELYTRAVFVSQKSVIDGGKSEAISRYILGTFLLDCVSRVQAAQEHLSKARELSLGKKWSAEKILDKKQDFLCKECANYLCRALVAASMELRKNGKAEEALTLIHRSHVLCEESGSTRRDVEMQTYFELGLTYHAVGMINWAKVAFRKYIEIAKLDNNPRSLCDGYLELAICFRSEGDLVRCHHNLVTYLETAASHDDVHLMALAHRYLGEFYLNNNDPKTASEYFRKAFLSFHEQCLDSENIPFEEWKPEIFSLTHDVELARVLTGLAEGQILTKPICHTILQAKDRKNQKELLKIIMWKNRGDMQIGMENIISDEAVMEEFELSEHEIHTEIESPTPSEDPLSQALEMKTVRFAIDRESFA